VGDVSDHFSRRALINAAIWDLSHYAKALQEATLTYQTQVKRTARVISDLCIPVAVDVVTDHEPEGIIQINLVERVVEVLGLEGKAGAYVRSNLRASLATCRELEMSKELRRNKADKLQPQNVWRLKGDSNGNSNA
jgi:hypothetical protein